MSMQGCLLKLLFQNGAIFDVYMPQIEDRIKLRSEIHDAMKEKVDTMNLDGYNAEGDIMPVVINPSLLLVATVVPGTVLQRAPTPNSGLVLPARPPAS